MSLELIKSGEREYYPYNGNPPQQQITKHQTIFYSIKGLLQPII